MHGTGPLSDPALLLPARVWSGGAILHPGDIRVVGAVGEAVAGLGINCGFQRVAVQPALALGVPVGERDGAAVVVPRGRPVLAEAIEVRLVGPAGHVHAVVAGVDAFVVHVHEDEPIGRVAEVGLLAVNLPHLIPEKRPARPPAGVEVDAVGADPLGPPLFLGHAVMLVLGAVEYIPAPAGVRVQYGNLQVILRRHVWPEVLRGAPGKINRGFVFQVAGIYVAGKVPSAGVDDVIVVIGREIMPCDEQLPIVVQWPRRYCG